MRSRRILIVEDEQEAADLLTHFLSSDGYQVEHAGNGQIALSLLSEKRWDLVLTDLVMPVLDGAELMREMRSRPELASIPVLMLTSIPEHLVRMMLVHPAALLQKPFRSGELLESIGRLLAHPRPDAAHP